MTRERKVYMNGKFIKESDAKISIFDSALMFGDMVFEMTRSFNKKHFKLKEHIERLFTGLKILRYDLSITKEELYDICIETARQNEPAFEKDDEHRLMIDVSRGVLGIYEDIDGIHNGPNIIVADFPLKWTVKGMSKLYKSGINNVVTSQRVIPSHLMDPKIKNRSRLFYLMANIEASLFKGENNWALMLDPDGFIAEGSGDNFFIIKDGVLISPEGRNMLRGITRQYIMEELAPRLNIPVKEKNIELFDAYEADEAFICATPFCMIPVTSINSVKIGNGKPGELFKSLIKEWSSMVGIDIIKQVENWNKDSSKKSTKNKVTPYKFK
ncbi:MAG: branched-chain amino acid aminotransferase [Gammaproteobacteria bacterium]|jgi:branched-chain amino acid aminotransferase|nr:branched-chain amino acid aminotransferase [Gammaproteobacteria bacterium]MBT5406208.1 branched-chain amino acid aminotransferase [Gammaproteobacteria bacterium]MBT5644609.1 branched-chain amino acid aminotransferase [Gammaproteobacteria bacterium]MBT5863684.1 branched-chain amino acid aminotransferase [Gammaproteobacteria bacterium]MBT6733860.1 branched-chain amino acid aminotransferase [Gammaproteobacteria bacterium]|tara:strand:+ start:8606 stop:9586 length:981 start_codon:yes stop_codon:yes gene_type:complete